MKDPFVSCLKESELAEGKMKAVRVRGNAVLLARVQGQVYAVSNRCPHMGCQLQGGVLSGYVVMCPCHGWKFDVRNGQYTENPLTALACYRCRSEGGKIAVEIAK